MEEWHQWSADNRSLETMRRIAEDAMAFEDDGEFYTYAEEHQLTVNEVVYYLNAYEAGGDVGLEAIRNPDIIPPDEARRAIKKIAGMLDDHFEGELPYRLTDEGTAIGIYHVQQRMNGERYLFPICQLRVTLATRQWHLYWMRKFGAWWPYSLPETGRKFTLTARIQQALDDEWGCFWV
ncbi:MAG: DUF3024 domain-containing protein [Chloroflexota bacterium]|nr:DUF3024 domain-containing protein [Chloroflexota bacterium]